MPLLVKTRETVPELIRHYMILSGTKVLSFCSADLPSRRKAILLILPKLSHTYVLHLHITCQLAIPGTRGLLGERHFKPSLPNT